MYGIPDIESLDCTTIDTHVGGDFGFAVPLVSSTCLPSTPFPSTPISILFIQSTAPAHPSGREDYPSYSGIRARWPKPLRLKCSVAVSECSTPMQKTVVSDRRDADAIPVPSALHADIDSSSGRNCYSLTLMLVRAQWYLSLHHLTIRHYAPSCPKSILTALRWELLVCTPLRMQWQAEHMSPPNAAWPC